MGGEDEGERGGAQNTVPTTETRAGGINTCILNKSYFVFIYISFFRSWKNLNNTVCYLGGKAEGDWWDAGAGAQEQQDGDGQFEVQV